MTNALEGIAPLPHLGLIRAEGEDAAKFLHGQLTQDFSLLGLSEARLAAFCSAKGRMQASFIGFKRSHTEILLVCHRDLLASTLKRLSMFVLRAKAKLSDATDDFTLIGLAGSAAPAGAPWTKTDAEVGAAVASIVSLYPAKIESLSIPRALWVAPAGTPLPDGPTLSPELWQWGEVRSGIATISPPIVEAFVPQMLNYESVGGVNFKKGCYPGQEVVARSQFRGTLKRRAYLAHCVAELKAGDDVFALDDPEQPCGTVAQSAPAPDGGFDAIVSLQTHSVGGSLHQGSATGPALTLLPLPYPLLEDI